MIRWLLWSLLLILSRSHRSWARVKFDARFGTYGIDGAPLTRRQAEALAWFVDE